MSAESFRGVSGVDARNSIAKNAGEGSRFLNDDNHIIASLDLMGSNHVIANSIVEARNTYRRTLDSGREIPAIIGWHASL
jgi:hypothetical protein